MLINFLHFKYVFPDLRTSSQKSPAEDAVQMGGSLEDGTALEAARLMVGKGKEESPVASDDELRSLDEPRAARLVVEDLLLLDDVASLSSRVQTNSTSVSKSGLAPYSIKSLKTDRPRLLPPVFEHL